MARPRQRASGREKKGAAPKGRTHACATLSRPLHTQTHLQPARRLDEIAQPGAGLAIVFPLEEGHRLEIVAGGRGRLGGRGRGGGGGGAGHAPGRQGGQGGDDGQEDGATGRQGGRGRPVEEADGERASEEKIKRQERVEGGGSVKLSSRTFRLLLPAPGQRWAAGWATAGRVPWCVRARCRRRASRKNKRCEGEREHDLSSRPLNTRAARCPQPFSPPVRVPSRPGQPTPPRPPHPARSSHCLTHRYACLWPRLATLKLSTTQNTMHAATMRAYGLSYQAGRGRPAAAAGPEAQDPANLYRMEP